MKFLNGLLLGLLSIIVYTLPAQEADGQALINGGFEIPHLTNGAAQNLVPGSAWLTGWTVGGTGGAINLFTNGESGTFNSYEGAQWLQFNAFNTAPGATLSQTFATTSGDSYKVSFALGKSVVFGPPGFGNVSIAALALGPGGTVMASNRYAPSNNSWATFTLNFTALSTNATLKFIDTSAQTVGADLTLDDVVVVNATLNPPPVVTLSPVSQTVLDGTVVTFTAAASNATSVQWYLETSPIAGATNTTLMVAASSAIAGSYSAEFANIGGSTNTVAAILTVVESTFINGGFETPHLTNGAVQSLVPGSTWLPGWTVGGTGGAIYLFTNGDSGTFDSYEGAQWLQFNAYNTAAGATLSKTFATTSGDSYEASFALGAPGPGNESMEVLVLGPGGAVLASNVYTPPNSSWATFTLNFTALSTNATLEFIDTSAQTIAVDLALDDVVVVDTGSNPPPVLPPVVTLSPVSQTVLDGTVVTFTAAASNGPTSVQWYLGSSAIAGATNTTLMVTASVSAAGSYSATFGNSAGSTNTAAAVLTVVEPALINGGFEIPHLTNGAVQSLVPGSTWLTGWTVGGTGGAIYLFTNGDSGTFDSYEGAQWLQFNAYDTAPGATISQTFGTTSGDSYGVSFALGTPGPGNQSMEVLVLGPGGAVLASNVYTPPNNSWSNFTLNFTAVSTNTTLEFVDASTQTVAVDLALDDVVVVDTGSNPPPVLPPVVTLSPVSQTVLDGTVVTFTAAASNGPTSVQWYLGSSAIAGATNTSLMVTASLSTAGSYSATFGNSAGSTNTAAAVLTVVEPALINGGFETPHLTNGAVQSLVPGSTWLTGWTVGGTGGAIYLFTNGDSGTFDSYEGAQWLQFNAYDTAPGATISQTFATTSGDLYGVSFALGTPGPGNQSMEVLVLAPGGAVLASNVYTPPNNSWSNFTLNFTAVSTNTTLEFVDASTQTVAVDLALDDVVVVDTGTNAPPVLPPVITLSPVSQTVLDGTVVTFTAAASNAPTSVQWYLGSSAIAGATNTSLMVTASLSTAGSYSATFGNSAGSTNTAAAVLTVVESALINGGFEIPHLTNGAVQSLVPGSTWLTGWTVGGTGGAIYLFTNGDSGTFDSYEGAQWLQFNAYNTAPGATISQIFATTSGDSYEASFALGTPGPGNQSMEVLVLGPGGAVLASNVYTPPNNSWSNFTLNFTAVSTNTTLEFVDASTQTVAVDLALDDVVVVDTTSNPQPISGLFHNPPVGARSCVAVSGGHATIQLVGLPGTLYNIEASCNLINWVLIGSVTSDSNGQIQFLDTNACQYHQRYYHASIP